MDGSGRYPSNQLTALSGHGEQRSIATARIRAKRWISIGGRPRSGRCHAEKLVAFSCKRRGFCPSCGGRRMAEAAALLVDEILPRVPIR
jgi:hypothetical protein